MIGVMSVVGGSVGGVPTSYFSTIVNLATRGSAEIDGELFTHKKKYNHEQRYRSGEDGRYSALDFGISKEAPSCHLEE